MNELKFELSVLITKRIITVYTNNETIKEEYTKLFRKEVTDEELNKVIGEIIDDNAEMHNNYIGEIPEDFELNNK